MNSDKANRFRIKVCKFKVFDIGGEDSKGLEDKRYYLKIHLDDIERNFTYVEKNNRDTCEFHSEFKYNAEFSSLNELKNRNLSVILCEKRSGLFAKDLNIGGVCVNFLTLATGPASIVMPISPIQGTFKSRISFVCEFEYFSDVQVDFSNLSIWAVDDSLLKNSGANQLSLSLLPDTSLPDVLWETDTKAVLTSKEKTNSWTKIPSLNGTMSIRTLRSLLVRVVKLNNEMKHECLIPLFQYSNLQGIISNFEESIVNEDGIQIGLLKGRVKLINMPFLTQMPRGTLTEKGVKDPTVIFNEVPLPRCEIYRSTETVNEPLKSPWVRIDLLEGGCFYFNNITKEKKIFDDTGLTVFSSSSLSSNTSNISTPSTASNKSTPPTLTPPYTPPTNNNKPLNPDFPPVIKSIPSPSRPTIVSVTNLTGTKAPILPPSNNNNNQDNTTKTKTTAGGWFCSNCNITNNEKNINCVKCLIPNSIKQNNNNNSSVGIKPNENSDVVRKGIVMDNRRNSGAARALDLSKKTGGWVCGTCTFVNEKADGTCLACGLGNINLEV